MSYTGQGTVAGQRYTWNATTQVWEPVAACPPLQGTIASAAGVGVPSATPRVLYVDGGTSVPVANQDGAICSPFDSISAALATIPVAVSASDQLSAFEIRIAPGFYDEDLIIPSGRIVILRAEGDVILTDNNTFGTQRNISWTNNSADTFGNTALLWIDPAILMGGQILIASIGVVSANLILKSASIGITGVVANAIDASGHTGPLLLEFYGDFTCHIRGTVNAILAPGATIVASDAEFDGNINVNQIEEVIRCAFRGSGGPPTISLGGVVSTRILLSTFDAGSTFSGIIGSFGADSFTIRNFILGGGVLAGATTNRLDRTAHETTAVSITANQNQPVVEVTAVPVTITLPLSLVDDEFWIKDSSGVASFLTPITVDTAGGASLIDGILTRLIATAFGSLHVKFNGVNWMIL